MANFIFLFDKNRICFGIYEEQTIQPNVISYYWYFRQCCETQEELNQIKIKLQTETEARENRELQLSELEQTLNKETERSTDLKVYWKKLWTYYICTT